MQHQFPTMPRKEFFFIQPCIYAVFGEAGVESLHSVFVTVGVAEKNFQWTIGFGHIRPVLVVMKGLYNGLYNGFTDWNGLVRKCP